jgi:hypothetical protein
MQEYSSINVSSYEAASLADRLTEESKDGWDVVAVVPTGSTITAYLSRFANGSSADAVATSVGEAETAAPEAGVNEPEPEPETAPEPEPAADPINEAAGWAVSPEATSDATESVGGGQEISAAVADVAPSLPTVPAATESVVSESVVGETPAVETPAAADAAPAGWYADPSARFELRYWDGAQWTEHVSRAGQQYTDPPVA